MNEKITLEKIYEEILEIQKIVKEIKKTTTQIKQIMINGSRCDVCCPPDKEEMEKEQLKEEEPFNGCHA